MPSLKTLLSNPIQPTLLLLEILYFASNLYSAPSNHTFLLSVRFALSFSFWLIFTVGQQASSFLYQILLVLIKVMILLNQVHYLRNIDWLEYHPSQQEALILDLLLKDLLGLFILNLMTPVKSIIKFVHSLSVIHVLSVLMTTSATEAHKDFILAQIILKCIMFSLSFYICCKLQRQEEGHKNANEATKKNEGNKANINMLTNLLDNLPEKMIVFDHLGHIKYFNTSLKNSLKAENCPTIENLKHTFFAFKLNSSHFASFSQLNRNDLLHTLSLNPLLQATKSLEKAQRVTNLPELFDFYLKNPEICVMGLTSPPTFHAQYYCKETNNVKDVQIRAQVVQFSSQKEKQLLIFVRENIQEKIGTEAIIFEKKKGVYQENFLSSLSHELRTPLNSNMAFLEQAMDSSLVPLYVKDKLIKPALISAKLLYYIVNDLLDYSLISANTLKLEVRPRDLLKTVNGCMDLFYPKAGEKDLKLNLIIQGEIPHQFSIDHRRVAQILINLLNNAIQFTITGDIEVILTRNSETSVMIAVKDTGIGISKESCERLKTSLDTGELREKIHENSIGIGLSLFVSNKLAKLLNPKNDSSQLQQQGIKFISHINQGSTFYFEVKDNKSSPLSPRKPSNSVEVTEEFDLKNDILNYSTRMLKNRFDSSAQTSPQGIQGRVLIVDDEVFNVIVIENFCKSLGIPVEKAHNGEEAIAKLKACKNDGQPPIKVIFMDINMPVKDGYQATMEIQKMVQKGEIKNVNIVGVTAYASKEKIEKGYSCGMDEVLNKPLSKEMIREVLGFYKLM